MEREMSKKIVKRVDYDSFSPVSWKDYWMGMMYRGEKIMCGGYATLEVVYIGEGWHRKERVYLRDVSRDCVWEVCLMSKPWEVIKELEEEVIKEYGGGDYETFMKCNFFDSDIKQ
jgi:hypothetical protein